MIFVRRISYMGEEKMRSYFYKLKNRNCIVPEYKQKLVL